MDAFYASVEQRDAPELRGRPVAVGGARERGVVAAASYEARAFGVRSAMPSATALRKCPELVFVPPRFAVYKEVSRQIHAIFAQYTPLIEPLSLDEAYLDVTENLSGLASATQIAREIRAKIVAETGLTASAGISYNKFLAKLASDYRKPDGQFVVRPGQGLAFVEGLAVGQFHGIGPVTAARLNQLGVFTGADLRAQPVELLTRHFGKAGRYYHAIAHAEDHRPVVPDRVRKSVGSETTFAHDLHELPELLAALPPRFESYLAGTRSPSKAHVHYRITGLSGPKVVPHNVLTFGLRGASLQWPGPARRINRWDLLGTYDNGPGHNPRTTVLTLRRCRIYSAAGKLDVALTLRNFRRPVVDGRFRGQTTLPELAALLPSAQWQARGGAADVDLRVRGQLPPRRGRPLRRGPGPPPLSLRGSLTLHQASLRLPARGADLRDVNVQIGLRDSVWQLRNASGVLNRMRFRASATTRNLLGYLNGQHPTARISGQFAVDELRLRELRELLKPRPRLAATALPFAGTEAARRRAARDRRVRTRAPRNKARLAATLARELIPAGLLLDVQLRCQRLLLASDTLSDLAVTVRHDGRQVQLQNLNGRMWGGQVRGGLQWPTDSANLVAPVRYHLTVHFPRLDYEQLMTRLNRPLLAPGAGSHRLASGARGAAKAPALRDLLLEANGFLKLNIDRVDLPEGENLREVRVQLEKYGGLVYMPYLRFLTPEGGHGEASGTARFAGLRLRQADTDLTLRYATLDVQRLLGLIASLTTAAPDSVPTARTRARAERKAERKAERAQRPGNPSLLASGVLTAVLRVEADKVNYGAMRGSTFRLVSHLRNGEARLNNCSLDALQGHLSLSGYMRSPANRAHHPTQLQVRLTDIELPALFGTMAEMGMGVLGADNVRGTLRGAADLRTDLGRTFLPSLANTAGYLKTDISGLELVNVEALVQALKMLRSERTSHLYFEPVQGEFVLAEGQVLIPELRLNSNLSNLDVSGHFGLSGATNLFVGLQPMKALFGNNDKRVERIQNNEPMTKADAKGKDKLNYLSLRRTAPGEKFQVRLFQRDEHRDAQARLLAQYRSYLLTQRLDTTVRMVR